MVGEQKEQRFIEQAAPWLDRARKDYAAFKLLTRSRPKLGVSNLFTGPGRTDYELASSVDPALSMYLVQQSVEKTVKALAIGSGQYTADEVRKKYRHDSNKLLLDFWTKLAEPEGERQPCSLLADIARSSRTEPAELVKMLELLERLYDKSLFFGSNLALGPGDTVDLSFRVAINDMGRELSAHYRVGSGADQELNLNDLATQTLLGLGGRFYDVARRRCVGKGENTRAPGFAETWSVGSLMMLASLTFEHEATSRYPSACSGGRGGKGQIDGCQDYADEQDVVKSLGHLGHILGLVLYHAEDALSAVAAFFGSERQ